MFNNISFRYIGILLLSFVVGCSSSVAENTLTDAEKKGGWELLFNGKDMNEWHNFKNKGDLTKWLVENGTMHMVSAGVPTLGLKYVGGFQLKYNGNIITLEIIIDVIRCNCMYESVSEKSKIENNRKIHAK